MFPAEVLVKIVSPSMRREWIEISFVNFVVEFLMSPSMRREWIEISKRTAEHNRGESPSMRREWIEIYANYEPLHNYESPSMRREWIEISIRLDNSRIKLGLPPCGGSGLKFFGFLVGTDLLNVSLHAEGVD